LTDRPGLSRELIRRLRPRLGEVGAAIKLLCYRTSVCIYPPVNNIRGGSQLSLLGVPTRQTPGRHKNARLQKYRIPQVPRCQSRRPTVPRASMVSPTFVAIYPHNSKMACIIDNVLRLTSPHRHDSRQRKQSPPRESSQSNGADFGPLVWVRVTRSGKLAPREPGGSDGSYWWPACVR
jgi:hypothetical protein